jgi:non-heme chloroperoxidase
MRTGRMPIRYPVIALVLALLASAGAAQPQSQSSPVDGRWQGTVKSGAQTLSMALRLHVRSPGHRTCFVNFIELQTDAYRCTADIQGERILVSVPEAGARIEAASTEGGAVIAGTIASRADGTQQLRLVRTENATAWRLDPAPHKQSFVDASDGTRLEVLDFGGQGAPLIFVAGLGASGHVFDTFAPRLTDVRHVYAISRRGYGESDRPEPSADAYRARRLGDDLLEVMDALKIERAVLAGWSVGGAELSSVASRFPNRASGLVYLDAAYGYAFYAAGNELDDLNVDIGLNDLRDRVVAARTMPAAEAAKVMDEILRVSIPDLAKDVALNRERLLETAALESPAPATARPNPASPARPAPSPPSAALPSTAAVSDSVLRNLERFGPLKVPILAIYASSSLAADIPPARAVSMGLAYRQRPELIEHFRAAHPTARVVVLEGAQHKVFTSNTEDVLREMRAFLHTLPN